MSMQCKPCTAAAVRACLPITCDHVGKSQHCMQEQYADETFVHVLPAGQIPHTRHVRGSNFTYISVFPDRLPGRAIVIAGMRLLRSKQKKQVVGDLEH